MEELDIGYNRIKNSGFKSVLDSIKENKALNLKFLGLKYNFVHDKILEEQLDAIEQNKEIGLEEIDLKNNVLSPGFLMNLWEQKFTKMSKKLKVDIFDVCAFMSEERLERTIWIETGEDPHKADIFNEIQRCEKECVKTENSHVGIPLLIRKKEEEKLEIKNKQNAEMFLSNLLCLIVLTECSNSLLLLNSFLPERKEKHLKLELNLII